MTVLKTTLPGGRTVSIAVRRHPRYRNVRLLIKPCGSVRLSAPSGLPEAFLRDFLEARRPWLEKHLPATTPSPQLPEQLELRAFGQTWQVLTSGTGGTLSCFPDRHVLRLGTTDAAGGLALLEGWLKRHARHHLGTTLAELSTATGLPYAGLSIRGQKTRWGSYSSSGNVSLNWKLLFLPEELMRYVLIHELCHSRHMNHSPAYWAEVARHVPDVPGLRQRMRGAAQFVPAWAEGLPGR